MCSAIQQSPHIVNHHHSQPWLTPIASNLFSGLERWSFGCSIAKVRYYNTGLCLLCIEDIWTEGLSFNNYLWLLNQQDLTEKETLLKQMISGGMLHATFFCILCMKDTNHHSGVCQWMISKLNFYDNLTGSFRYIKTTELEWQLSILAAWYLRLAY